MDGIKESAEQFCRQPLPWDLTKGEYEWRMGQLIEPQRQVLQRRSDVIVASTRLEAPSIAQKAGHTIDQVTLVHTPEAFVWAFFGPGAEDERTVPMAVFTDGKLRCYSETHDLTLGYGTAITELCAAYGVDCHITS